MMLDNKNWISARCSASDQKKLIVFLAQSGPVQDNSDDAAPTTTRQTPSTTKMTQKPTAKPTTEFFNPTSQ